jgi:biopolymer transport protein ExbB
VPEFIEVPLRALINMRRLGGPIVVWIFIACVLMWTIVVERAWYFYKVHPVETERQVNLWRQRSERSSWSARAIRAAMISRLNAGMTRNMQVLRVLVPMCPLLGLIGTVVGMLTVFDAMAALGSADARSMATGVSEAMTCTLAGLAVSITGLYPVYYFRSRARRETERLAERFTMT